MSQEHQEYIQTKVNPILENLVTQVLLERPENPVPFMVRWLASQSPQAKEYFAGAGVGEAEKLKTEVKKLQEEVRELQLKLGQKDGAAAVAHASADTSQAKEERKEIAAADKKEEKAEEKKEEEKEGDKEAGKEEAKEEKKEDKADEGKRAESKERKESKESKGEKEEKKDEDEEEEDEEEEDDDDDVVDAAPPPAAYLNRGPRSSVSAEAYGDWNKVKAFTPPVHEKTEEQKTRIRKVLGQSFLFNALDADSLSILVGAMVEKLAKAGERLIQEGDDGDVMYIIEKGVADCKKKLSGEEKVVKVCGEGDFFGELALLYNCPRAASVDAREDLTLWQLDRETFTHLVRDASMKKREQYEKFLKSVQILKNLGTYELSQLADSLQKQAVKTGDVVIKQGDEGDRFYLVEDGELVVATKSGDSADREVNSYKSGDYFGELALLKDEKRQATITARTDGTLLWVDRRGFKLLLGDLRADMEKLAAEYKP
eukprot:CAMPEP_0206435200 /NCGR_PEP_ID=MMETSP0324_2-20121206/9687_1 /ASSEMBLY_ACC=CAM_ASM_000836 /TAXON_ID=2866 /ORGANISM="Crypthecodinium cohnii, Strain Seligo" /LENGTH=485 /DNA_ID=CAMNT_0053902011 /DNA_START=72 /DNA_END=1529 /DNA_ORIENTATION=+